MSNQLEEPFYRYMEQVVAALEAEKKRHSITLAAYPAFETTEVDPVVKTTRRDF